MQRIPVTDYLFVDGGCVRAELDVISRRYVGEAGHAKISWDGIAQNYTKVFYYDALPTRNDGEDDEAYRSRNASMLDAHATLSRLDRFHVYEGDVRKARGRRDRAQQKKIDVMIAVDMLLHTFRKNMDTATLIASDLDFASLLLALVREGMFITLWYPPSATNQELRSSADSRREFTPKDLGNALLTLDGRPLLPVWQPGIVHYRQNPVIHQWNNENAGSVVVSGDGNHFLAELMAENGRGVSYAAHHDLRILLITAEESQHVRLPDEAFATCGGRPI